MFKKIIKPLLVSLVLVFVISSENTVLAQNFVTEETLPQEIKRNMMNYNQEFSIEFKGDTSKIKKIVSDTMKSLSENEIYAYTNMSKWELAYKYKNDAASLNFKVKYNTNKKFQDYVDAVVKKETQKIKKTSKTDFAKVKAIHDYIVLKAEYSSKTKNSRYDSYTLLTENKAVCQAYALLFYKMAKELGVEVKYVRGFAKNERHDWNMVKIEGEWYHIDVTWDDPIGNNKNEIYYKYFLISNKKISKTHTWTKNSTPQAKSEKFKSFHSAGFSYNKSSSVVFKHLEQGTYYELNLNNLSVKKISKTNYDKAKKDFLAKNDLIK